MIDCILAVSIRVMELMTPFILAAYAVIFVLVLICLVLASRYFRTAGKEQKLMRIEMGKLAEEVHLLRQELKAGKEKESSAESG